MADLLKPKEVTVTSLDGDEKVFRIHRLPAVQGREIVANITVSALPKLGDYAVNEATMLKMMAFVEAKSKDKWVRLENQTLVDNHVSDWEMLFQLEKAMLSYNTSFFGNGKIYAFFGTISQSLKALLTSTLTDLLAASSKPKGPPSTS
jgi:hypothetical protein